MGAGGSGHEGGFEKHGAQSSWLAGLHGALLAERGSPSPRFNTHQGVSENRPGADQLGRMDTGRALGSRQSHHTFPWVSRRDRQPGEGGSLS